MPDDVVFDPKKLGDQDYLVALQKLVHREGGLLSVDASAFARLVKRTSDGQLRARWSAARCCPR